MANKNEMSYVLNMGKALSAWRDENTDKRSVILLASSEREDGGEDGRTVAVYTDGSMAQQANLLCAVIEKNRDFREAIKMAAQLYDHKHRRG